MRHRVLSALIVLLALVAASCGGGDSAPGADRSVNGEDADWERDQAIQRTILIEGGMEAGLKRSQASCLINTTLDSGDWTLEDLDGIDLSALTSSNASRDLAATLAEALVDCGPKLDKALEVDIPGALAIPGTHVVEYDCVVAAYTDAWHDAYVDRFDGGSIDEPTEIDVSDRVVDIVAGCDAGGAVILGASNDGHLDTHALNTLGWECLVNRLEPDRFMPAFPFPEEPGDALDRLGSSVLADATYCEEFSSPGGVDN